MHSLLNHPLVVDFPEPKEAIQVLKLSAAHLKQLLDQ